MGAAFVVTPIAAIEYIGRVASLVIDVSEFAPLNGLSPSAHGYGPSYRMCDHVRRGNFLVHI